MKKMPKKLFDEIIYLSRAYWEDGEEEILNKRIRLAQKVEKATGVDWLHTLDFVDSIVAGRSLLPGAENEKIYETLSVLGWEVVDDVEMEHSTR